jgi:hypothetical protein
MRIAAEKRADGVFVAAGVELVEPERRWETGHGFKGVTPRRVAKPGETLGWETANSLRAACPDKRQYQPMFFMPLVLKTCGCSAVFVGDTRTRRCPTCQRASALASTRASLRRRRAKRRSALAGQCRHCGAPMTAKLSTKAFCSVKCRVAAHRASAA